MSIILGQNIAIYGAIYWVKILQYMGPYIGSIYCKSIGDFNILTQYIGSYIGPIYWVNILGQYIAKYGTIYWVKKLGF
jgi:hypothetical protein